MSLHVVISGDRQTIIAADSRAVTDGGEVSNDYAQKLFQCGWRTICGISGFTVGKTITGTLFCSQDRVEEICADYTLHDRPRAILDRIDRELHEPIAALVAEHAFTDDFLFESFCVHRRPDGVIDLLQMHFPIVIDAGKPRLAAAEVTEQTTSEPFLWSCGQELGGLKKFDTEFTADDEILKAVDYIFESAKQHNSQQSPVEIGGPIDVAAIDSVGLRWLRKKALPADRTPTWFLLVVGLVVGAVVLLAAYAVRYLLTG
jgi:hypothetical protein